MQRSFSWHGLFHRVTPTKTRFLRTFFPRFCIEQSIMCHYGRRNKVDFNPFLLDRDSSLSIATVRRSKLRTFLARPTPFFFSILHSATSASNIFSTFYPMRHWTTAIFFSRRCNFQSPTRYAFCYARATHRVSNVLLRKVSLETRAKRNYKAKIIITLNLTIFDNLFI